jgi:DNA-binding NarL/FixJ family response regulator
MKPENSSEPPALLIVEDHAAMRAGLRVLLQTAFPGCRILEADNSAHALAICFEHQPRLILMDVCLPDANGIEFTGRLLKLFRDIGVIVVSNLSAQIYFEQARAAGALSNIVKDKLADELIPAVARVLGIVPAAGRR